MRFCFFFWFFKNCELIRDSSSWCLNCIPSIHDLVIIIGLRFVTYTFGSRSIYKRCWVGASIKNLNFNFFRQVFQYYLLGLKVCGSHQFVYLAKDMTRFAYTRFPHSSFLRVKLM